MDWVVEDIGSANGEEWDRFLELQPAYSPFQSAALLCALEGTESYRAYGRLFRERTSGEIRAGYVFHRIQELTGLASPFATRVILNGGPVIASEVRSEGALGGVVDDLVRHPGLGGIYLEVWHCREPGVLGSVLESRGFEFVEHLNYRIDLRGGSEIVFNGIHRRTRQYIRRSAGRITVREASDGALLTPVYQQLQETYRRVKIPLIERSVFEDAVRSPVGLLLLAEKDARIIGARVVLRFGRGLYDWYAGSSAAHHNEHSNEALVWAALDHGLRHGYEWFDFGGAGRPDRPYGPRVFKAKFGGQLVRHGRHRLVLAPLRERALRVGLRARERWLQPVSRPDSGDTK